MKTYKHRTPFILITFLILTVSLTAFKSIYIEKAPLEKIYTQTDRSFYFPGETIWFKSYIVSEANTISSISDIMNAELISPKGTSVRKIKLSIENGYAYGDFDINNSWVGGIYTLKMYTNWMRNFGEDAFFTKKITIQKIVKPNLLLNLKFEKEGYGKASTVIANFEVKDLKNKPLKNKEITFETSIKGKKITSKTITTNNKGKANPTFVLPDNLQTTDVVLNILVPYNGTTESISRSVPVVLDNIDLQFFPESGKTISGTTNKIAFKAINEFGKPVDVSGEIVDKNNVIISTFNSFHDGMGAFSLSPKKGETYYAKIKKPFISSRNIELPKVYENGTRFSITTDSLKTTLNIFSTENKPLYLEISNASQKLLGKTITSTKKEISINTKSFPIGITKFSLLNTNKDIVAERLVFINENKKLHVNIQLDKTIYETREKVNVSISTTDHNNNPIPSNLSVSIADNKLLSFADDKQDHILSYLLISSELKGKIHKPSFYFNPKESKSHLALDYIMLTHGWRNYLNIQNVTLENASFKPEQKSIQSGTIVDEKGNPVKANLLLFDQYGNKVLVFESNEHGKFSFKSKEGSTSTLIVYTENSKKLKILEDKYKEGYYSDIKNAFNKENSEKTKVFSKNESPLQEIIEQKAVANIALTEDISSLDEVTINAGYYKTSQREQTGSIAYIVAAEITPNPNTVLSAMQGRISGVNIIEDSGIGNTFKIMIRGNRSISGNNDPLFIIDGVPHNQNEFGNIDANQVSSVTVLKDDDASAIYGPRAANGVVLVTTKNNKYLNNRGKKKLNNAKYNNYTVATFYNKNLSKTYTPQQFYIPKYGGKILPEERTDFRQTIYWNPIVQTDENGKAEFEFYNSDAITSFKITAEGIGFNGLLGRQEKMYATNKILNIDFKSPNYMTLNDTISLPLTITNETKNSITTNLEITLPEHVKLIEPFDPQITVTANKSVIKNIQVVPIKTGKDILMECRLKSENFSDIVKRKTTILSPYFPTQISISDSKSQNFQFDINHVVDNSIKAEFNIYTDVVGDVMNGIEGLIRKPYGCFEQTSSSTYPNIMVLKYLKESGKSNPEIENKAMNFIKEGYERLISFETKEGGFEWFGKTPPHETLTAYGILEFTEMKEVYDNVDQKMIDRTVKWLLNRKDGKGGFKKSKKGYDSFASSPLDVSNAYIVYALSQAKINADISLEHITAYNEALKSKDTYKMALLALSSYNLNQKEKATVLINKIKENIDAFGFKKLPVNNTITRSYGNAKNIETTAFTLLALMKEDTPNEFLISNGIEYLVSQRKHNTFGSTQSTAMALKALIEYTKSQKRKIINQNDTIELIINGQTLTKKLEISNNGKITINQIKNLLKEGKQNVEVRFVNPKVSFPYSLNVTWDSYLPDSSTNCPINLETIITDNPYKVGDNVSMSINVTNKKNEKLGMALAIVGIPSGTTAQPWQLKELLEQNKIAYYEVFDNYLVFYWRQFNVSETKTIRLDLKADIAGIYQAPASTAYLYYGDEYSTWISGNKLEIRN
ncbi:TonB-dependent receptor plug domain-containing protein [Flavivirga aquimarina]|uniref:TonB-dependent receptor plug domain-containing protein n=1 Tax=Flavivirga aquimarina TaxID=2027862 RepID=A0ABT8WB53_9FLAO|nr:TonB-dependent receptor plug domain-containing protein [Flavivirga aquimarina]MDO5970378.1 TonB-dependent receptor plug domain-containing protein [Flavivirga aquimarina]